MATIQSDNGWTKTELGDGWVKLVEVADPFGSNAADEVLSTPITNTTVNAVADGPTMPIINELKAAGEFVVEVTTGAGSSLNADLYVDLLGTGGTYLNYSGKIVEDVGPSSTKIFTYSDAITNGLKLKAVRDAGTAANPITFSIVYYNGGPNQSDVQIAGTLGADPS